jgi:NAD(P)-dependent dehydrogenase (short-subunit alcohol dehydrogenase family)
MRTVIITGSAGLIGSEAVKRFAKDGMCAVGIDNDMRAKFFGAEVGDFDLVFGTPRIRLRLFRQLRGRYLQAVPVAEVSIEIEIDQHDA